MLSRRALNRALLARQMLLERERVSALTAIERLAGMQAQVPRPPFVGLWMRLEKFQRADLARLLSKKLAVRATAMRGTIHLMSTRDFLAWRPVLAPMLAAGADSITKKRLGDMDREWLYARGREFFTKTPAPFGPFRDVLARERPTHDVRAMAYSVRMNVPLVMIPGDAPWSFPPDAAFTLAETWLGTSLPPAGSADAMVLRYLAAFGPATPGDAQTWSGVRALREVFERLRPNLVTFRDERKRELFDLPQAPRPDEDTPAPARFLPEYDNALLSHDDRTRIMADEHRSRVIIRNLQVVGTFLVDGFVAGTWKVVQAKRVALLQLAPFAPLSRTVRRELEREGEALLHFVSPEFAARQVIIGG